MIANSGLVSSAARQGLDEPVPACPGWQVRDVVGHLGRIFATKEPLIRTRSQEEAEESDSLKSPDSGLIDWFKTQSRALSDAFRVTPSNTKVWSWSDDHSVGFWLRRMAHETLIHRVDVEQAHGENSPIVSELADDGIDEVLTIFMSGCPDWADFELTGNTTRIESSENTWDLEWISWAGISPRSGKRVGPMSSIQLSDQIKNPDCVISGSSADLDLWIWGRGSMSDLAIAGDIELAHSLRTLASEDTD